MDFLIQGVENIKLDPYLTHFNQKDSNGSNFKGEKMKIKLKEKWENSFYYLEVGKTF